VHPVSRAKIARAAPRLYRHLRPTVITDDR
jgi:hypothetical protein